MKELEKYSLLTRQGMYKKDTIFSSNLLARIFYPIWAIVKLFFDQATREKIVICSSNWQKQLLGSIDEDKLPEFLGGSLSMEENQDADLSTTVKPNWITKAH